MVWDAKGWCGTAWVGWVRVGLGGHGQIKVTGQ